MSERIAIHKEVMQQLQDEVRGMNISPRQAATVLTMSRMGLQSTRHLEVAV